METKTVTAPKPINHRERTAASAARRLMRDAKTLSAWLAANPAWAGSKKAQHIRSAIAAAKTLGATPPSK